MPTPEPPESPAPQSAAPDSPDSPDCLRPKRQRFSRAERLLRPPEFQRAFRTGSRAKAHFLVVVAVEGQAQTRLGLSVGKRVYKHAHRRNRLKRCLREAFRQAYQELPSGLDLVLVPAIPKCHPTLEEARAELVYLAAKAHRRLLEKRAQEAAQ
ncbi:MAG: ribonuclease P protein component [Planctomycetes bacterium]|nr:ribonuclease P protein component [Planctomycetota bacterium]HPF14927.1 ribonuclease P protein component [Planctomycetota bacterium]HRV82858.1 ribonuclease P protein component [Planctomycetota bacterium]